MMISRKGNSPISVSRSGCFGQADPLITPRQVCRGVLSPAGGPGDAPPGRALRGAYCAAGVEAAPFLCCSQRWRIFSWRCSIFAKRALSAELTVVFC